MGIDGLIPALKPIAKSITLEAYRNQVVAVDAYVWLHKAVLSAGYDIDLGKPKDRYVWVCTKWLDLFASFGVTPYLVFDGRKLPSKLSTETERLQRRKDMRELALQHLRQGRRAEAEECFKKATDISPEIAYKLIEVLQKRNLPYVVSPYESDAQLAFLARNGHVAAVVTEDSDLIVFECPKVLYKLDYDGNCIEISYSDIVKAPYLNGITQRYPEKFRHHCILSGCDYLPSVRGVGLKTAAKIFQSAQTYLQAIRQLRNNSNYNVPPNYEKDFFRADLTFRFQWVYDPTSKSIVNLTPPDPNIPTSGMKFLGERITDPDLVAGLVSGRLDPDTLEPIIQNKNNPSNQKPISYFFKQPQVNKAIENKTINPVFKTNIPATNNNLVKNALESIDLDSFCLSNSDDELLCSPVIRPVSVKKEVVVTPTQSRHFPSSQSSTNLINNEYIPEKRDFSSLSQSSRAFSECSYSSLTVFSKEDSLELPKSITEVTNKQSSVSEEASLVSILPTPSSPIKSLARTPINLSLKSNSDIPFSKSPSLSPLDVVSSSETRLDGSIQDNSPVACKNSSYLLKPRIPSPKFNKTPPVAKENYSTVCHTFSSGKDTRAVLWEAVRQTSSTDSILTSQSKASAFLNKFRCDSVKPLVKRPSEDSNPSEEAPVKQMRMSSTLLHNKYVQSLTNPSAHLNKGP